MGAARYAAAELGIDLTPEEYLRRAAAIRDAMWPTADWMPGASELLDHLCRCATSSCVYTPARLVTHLLHPPTDKCGWTGLAGSLPCAVGICGLCGHSHRLTQGVL